MTELFLVVSMVLILAGWLWATVNFVLFRYLTGAIVLVGLGLTLAVIFGPN